MGTTAEKFKKLIDSKTAIKQALINKGYKEDEVGDIFSQYGYLIENIPSTVAEGTCGKCKRSGFASASANPASAVEGFVNVDSWIQYWTAAAQASQ